ncbi:MAG: hypothetical protein ACI4D8_01735 [Wujia sp.]
MGFENNENYQNNVENMKYQQDYQQNNMTYHNYAMYQDNATYQNSTAYQNNVPYRYLTQEANIDSRLGKKRILNPSSLVSLMGALLIYLGMVLPLVDFQHFHESVDIQYNFMKVCKNVGLISDMWAGIPFGLIIAVIILVILSFVNVPILKLIPCLLVIAMFSLMLLDVNNVIKWITDVLDKYFSKEGIVVNFEEIVNSLMYGLYFLVAGTVMSLVSCFLKGARQ